LTLSEPELLESAAGWMILLHVGALAEYEMMVSNR
jgi:hypothetical protein